MSFAAFSQPWFAEIIERFSPETGSPPLDGIARAMLASSCILAQEISRLADAVEKANKQRE